MNSVGINNSPASGQINEILKNVASMNNKVGGKRSGPKRKTRKQKQRGKTRKNLKARKGTRKSGGARPNDYSNCDHIYEEEHKFPSMLIRIKDKTPANKKNVPGPARPRKFYDCEEILDKNGNTTHTFKGRSCENPRFDGMILRKKDIEETGLALHIEDLVNWCCPSRN